MSIEEKLLWAIIGMTALTAITVVLLKRAPRAEDCLEQIDEVPLIHVKWVFRQCYNHRESLKAYHSELCRIFDVDPHSDEGDDLAECVFDGKSWNHWTE